MEDAKTNVENINGHVKGLLDTYTKLAKITVTQNALRGVTGAFTFIIIGLLSLCALIFAGIGLAIWFSDLLNNRVVAYFCVAVLYILIMVIFFIVRRKLIFPVLRNLIIRKLYG